MNPLKIKFSQGIFYFIFQRVFSNLFFIRLVRFVSILSLIILIVFKTGKSEGTKQFRPLSTNFGNMQINDKGRPFAMESNSNPLNRLHFHINSITEKVYFGFNHQGAGTATFRIRTPGGRIVYNRTNIPTSGNGFINTFNDAVAGPKLGGIVGYNPLTFIPDTTGDFYMEFTTSLVDAYHFDLFDLTVVSASNKAIPGRLWSNAWDINTRAAANRYYGKFYVYTDDGFVSILNMNGIQPYGFVISCNNSGPGDIALGNNENRKSMDGNSTRPQYKLFLNDPDSLAYPSGVIPIVINNLDIIGKAYYGKQVLFSVNLSKPGVIEMVIDLNSTLGYQTGTEDVILVQQLNAGFDTLVWDGKNGLGDFVDPTTPIALITSSFSAGITHFPVFDAETHLDGFKVTKVRPMAGNPKLYWDDSKLMGGVANVAGTITDAHKWPLNFGDERTINTWWEGYRLDVLRNFQLTFEDFYLPVSLVSFFAELKVNAVHVNWTTASESNSSYFEILRSTDMVNYVTVALISAVGNSNALHSYFFEDTALLTGIVYYILKQFDVDGKSETFEPIAVSCGAIMTDVLFKINEFVFKMAIAINNEEEYLVSIVNEAGVCIYSAKIKLAEGVNELMITNHVSQPSFCIFALQSNKQTTTRKFIL